MRSGLVCIHLPLSRYVWSAQYAVIINPHCFLNFALDFTTGHLPTFT